MLGMKRACEDLLRSYLKTFPCVAVIGVRQCGKTTLLKSLPRGWKHFDLERRADHDVVSRDPDAFFRLNPRHVALDEAQLAPEAFPALRVAIDEHRAERGRFVITGSSSPEMLRSVSESLAGRVGIIELAPFSWEEVTQQHAETDSLHPAKFGAEALSTRLPGRGRRFIAPSVPAAAVARRCVGRSFSAPSTPAAPP